MMSKIINEQIFVDAYHALNPAQKEAVDTIEGPVMVIAGPGTGKTQVLTLRIANIMRNTDTAPEQILALTFTDSGAKAMRERLRTYIGTSAYRVPIFTFHGFAEQLISEYPEAYPRIVGGRPVTDIEQVMILENILESEGLAKLRPAGKPTLYVAPLRAVLSDMKREYITPDIYAGIIADKEALLATTEQFHEKGAHKGKEKKTYTDFKKEVQKDKEVLRVYQLYEASLREQFVYDFDDMIVETVSALARSEDMKRSVQETYQYIHADEHQDVNGSQNKILEQITDYHTQPNIFVVGDEKQAIYRFQGASLDNFLYFESTFGATKTISLTENYRSGQEILDVAHDLISVEDSEVSALRIPLIASAVSKSSVELRSFSHQAVEDEFVVSEVKSLTSGGVDPSSIAVIVRSNKEVEHFALLLRGAHVPASASADGDILSHPLTEAIASLIRAIVEPEHEETLFAVLHGSYWKIEPYDLFTLCAGRNFSTSLSKLVYDEELLKTLPLQKPERILHFARVLDSARVKAVDEAPHQILAYVLQESGLLDQVGVTHPTEGVRVIRRIYDEIEAMVVRSEVSTLKDVHNILALRRAHHLPLMAPYIKTQRASVQVMTAHKSKGLEFSYVFAPHLIDNAWGGIKKGALLKSPAVRATAQKAYDSMDDELRLLYVVITRAKSCIALSYSAMNSEGKERIASRLIEKIDPALIVQKEVDDIEQSFSAISAISTPPPILLDTEFCIEMLHQRGFSATSLNTYLQNPWDFFYRTMLRIPEVQSEYLQFGSAIHAVLERITKQYTAGVGGLSDAEVKRLLEYQLGRLPVSSTEYSRLLERGLLALYAYIPYVEKSVSKNTLVEQKFRVGMETGIADFPEVFLTGKLDRLDLNEAGKVVQVVDYKTGKAKSRNYIEGKTANSDGGYKRQLVFYALLLSLYDNERYSCREGILSFVEPTNKGYIVEEAFTVTDEEIATLKRDIIEAVQSIISGGIWRVSYEDSKYAILARQLVESRLHTV